MKRLIINPALSLLIKHVVIGHRRKAPNFSAFHWSPHGSVVFGQHFVTTRVVHLPKWTETNLVTESDEAGLIIDLDQAVRAVHSCNTWFIYSFVVNSQISVHTHISVHLSIIRTATENFL